MERIAPTEIMIYLTGVASVFLPSAFGAFGAIVHYLYLVVKEVEEYKVSRIMAFIVMGCFVGIVVHEFTTEVFGASYPGLVLVSGFLFLKILEFFDKSGLDLLLKRLNIKK